MSQSHNQDVQKNGSLLKQSEIAPQKVQTHRGTFRIRWGSFSKLEKFITAFSLATGVFGASLSANAFRLNIPAVWFFAGHFHNLTGSFATYFFLTLFLETSSLSKFLVVFFVSTTGELCQLVGLYGGTFDMLDIFFYLLGSWCGYFVEKTFFEDPR